MTMVRESLYAAGYLGVAPLLREALEEQPAVRSMPGGPLILSGVTAGLLATVTTHPADTIKTRMQVLAACSVMLDGGRVAGWWLGHAVVVFVDAHVAAGR